MSASNWDICPRCKARELSRIADAKERADHAYGAVPVEEFDRLRAEADKPFNEETFRTFREDYEFYGAEDGAITATYSGECSVCGLSCSFKHVELFFTTDSGSGLDPEDF